MNLEEFKTTIANYTQEERNAVVFIMERLEYLYGENHFDIPSDDWEYAYNQILDEYVEMTEL